MVVDQGIDVGLSRCDTVGVSDVHRAGQIRSMMVPVDSAPPAHMVINAVL
jgi:hypothetical protein